MTVAELVTMLGACEPGAEVLASSPTSARIPLVHVSYYVVDRQVILYADWEGKSDGAPAEDQPGKD